ncbi:MAG: type 1 glutamine amidotransferase [Bdellovibrionota bacterium]
MQKLRVHVLQHSDDTPPGTVVEWLTARGHDFKLVKLQNGDALPRLGETDWLIILGGGMNVDEVEKYPFLTAEKALLKEAIATKKTCLGLCLGGQLLAQALGAEVKRHAHWEVGWHGLHLGSGPESRLIVFQWHQDTFDLPAGSHLVATNSITENQAFAFGENIIGVQFHPEATEEWVRECAADTDYPVGPHVQPAEQVLEGIVFLVPMKKWFFTLLERMEATATKAANKK